MNHTDPSRCLRGNKLSARYGKRATVFHDLSIDVVPGHITGLVGSSGSGKTTLAGVLCGRLPAASGEVSCDGVRVTPGRRNPGIAMVGQAPRLAASPTWTLGETIAEPVRLRQRRKQEASGNVSEEVERAAVDAGLELDLLIRRPHQVSDGQLQRAVLARALAQHPRYVICDEATSMLDPLVTAHVMATLRAKADEGIGILMISHDHRLLAACADRTLTLTGGAVVSS